MTRSAIGLGIGRALAIVALVAGALARADAAPVSSAPIRLAVDASLAARGVFHSRQVLPVASGPLTLTYPEWIPGEHSPTGPISQLVGLRFSVGGRELQWRRDPVDMFAFHLDVPAGAAELVAEFDYLSPPESFGGGYGEGPNATAHFAVILWNQQLLVPNRAKSDELLFQPSLRLPAGWKLDSALERTGGESDQVEFAPVTLTALVDSPVLAGDLFRTYEIGGGEAPVRLALAAEDPADLEVPPERLEQLRRVVDEAQALFGARHYRRYVWLVALSDLIEPNGLEHPESSDDRLPARIFGDEGLALAELRILPHEYVHSWNGKYRRPKGLATGDYANPMDGGLLWIYEGLTRYLGDVVLATRAGLRSPEATRDYLAWMASQLGDARPGRRWRPLADTATAVQVGGIAPAAGSAMRRGLDYYEEGALVWLEADLKIRELSAGKRSLDDFCRRFFGPPGGAPSLRTYELDDVFQLLAEIAPFDWRAFFAARIDRVRPEPPVDGLTAAGWKLAYAAAPNGFMAGRERSRHTIDWGAALGLSTNDEGKLKEVVQGSPAFAAGLVPGAKIVGVGGAAWSPEALVRGLADAVANGHPLSLIVERQKRLSTVELSPTRGVVYPHLEALPGSVDRLAEIFHPRNTSAPH